MLPAIVGFVAYMVAWIGWPGRRAPERRRLWAAVGVVLAIAVTAFMLMGLIGYYWPVDQWRAGLHLTAAIAEPGAAGTEWVGDMYFGLLIALIRLYGVVLAASALLPSDVYVDGVEPATAPTGIWWPYAVGAGVVVVALLAALWPHLG